MPALALIQGAGVQSPAVSELSIKVPKKAVELDNVYC